MSLFKFIAWFCVGTALVTFLVSTLENSFLVGLICGFIFGVIGAKD